MLHFTVSVESLGVFVATIVTFFPASTSVEPSSFTFKVNPVAYLGFADTTIFTFLVTLFFSSFTVNECKPVLFPFTSIFASASIGVSFVIFVPPTVISAPLAGGVSFIWHPSVAFGTSLYAVLDTFTFIPVIVNS